MRNNMLKKIVIFFASFSVYSFAYGEEASFEMRWSDIDSIETNLRRSDIRLETHADDHVVLSASVIDGEEECESAHARDHLQVESNSHGILLVQPEQTCIVGLILKVPQKVKVKLTSGSSKLFYRGHVSSLEVKFGWGDIKAFLQPDGGIYDFAIGGGTVDFYQEPGVKSGHLKLSGGTLDVRYSYPGDEGNLSVVKEFLSWKADGDFSGFSVKLRAGIGAIDAEKRS